MLAFFQPDASTKNENSCLDSTPRSVDESSVLRNSADTSHAPTPQIFRNAPQKTRAEKLAAVDQLMADFDRKVAWVEKQLYKAIDHRFYWWHVDRVTKAERPEFAAILARLRLRDPVINRAIDSVNFIDGGGVTVWFWVGANHG